MQLLSNSKCCFWVWFFFFGKPFRIFLVATFSLLWGHPFRFNHLRVQSAGTAAQLSHSCLSTETATVIVWQQTTDLQESLFESFCTQPHFIISCRSGENFILCVSFSFRVSKNCPRLLINMEKSGQVSIHHFLFLLSWILCAGLC